MPEHLRALIVIVILASVTFAFASRPASGLVGRENVTRWRNLWFGLTLTAFLAHSFWLYAFITGLLVVLASSRQSNPTALFFISMFAVPAASLQVPGFGFINYLVDLNHVRILALALLLPAFVGLAGRTNTMRFGRSGADKLIVAYIVLVVALQFRGTTVTDVFRHGFYAFTDVFLPYFVISRTLKNMQSFKTALFAFVLASLILAAIGVFEMMRNWLLYAAVVKALDPAMGFGAYLGRAGSLRASATTGHSIALGYVLTVAIGLFLFLEPYFQRKSNRRLGIAALAVGLISSLSRGPWVGTAVLVGVFIATGRAAARRLAILAIGGMLALTVLGIVPGGNKILDLLPFVGTVDKANIDYRAKLLDNAMIVIERNPLFGSGNYRNTPEMQAMRQGQGIIDIVNTYVSVALETGLVGLTLFVGFFALVLRGTYKAMKSLADKDDEMVRLGRSLLATLVGILVIIGTVSSVTIIPVVYWSVAGLGVAYAQMVRERLKNERAGVSPPLTLAQAPRT